MKSDGTKTYFIRDLAAIKYRLKRWKPDLIVYEVGTEQTLHFKQLFLAVELLGWAKKEMFFHLAHGLIRMKEGKLSTRKGRIIHLEDVLKEAIKKAKRIIEKSESVSKFSEKEKEKIAKAVGIGAVKYNDLSQHPSREIVFKWEKILNLQGNSAPYLQYTFARTQGVLKKTKFKRKKIKIRYQNFNPQERILLITLYKFPEIVRLAAKTFSPNLICNFAFDLAQKYNLFYKLYPIIKAETSEIKNFRLALTLAVGQVLKNCLLLLGIFPLEKM